MLSNACECNMMPLDLFHVIVFNIDYLLVHSIKSLE